MGPQESLMKAELHDKVSNPLHIVGMDYNCEAGCEG